MQYQPPVGSTLEFFVAAYKSKLKSERVLNSGKKWFHLSAMDSEVDLDFRNGDGTTNREETEVAGHSGGKREGAQAKNRKIKSSIDPFSPTARYCKVIEVYLHAPLDQHKDLVPQRRSDFCCPHCQKSGNLVSHGWHYRPAHKLDGVIWVLHERLICGNRRKNKDGCGRTFANFHPNFMKQLPNVVTEQFPFLMTQAGVGMHQSLIWSFAQKVSYLVHLHLL